MKIAAIGDPHGHVEKIENIPLNDADLALITGDLGQADAVKKLALQYLGPDGRKSLKHGSHAEDFRQAFMKSYNSALEVVEHIARFCPVFTIRGNADLSNDDIRKFSRMFDTRLPFLYDSLKKMHNVRLIDNVLALFHGARIGGIKYFADVSWVEEFELAGIDKIKRRATVETAKTLRILERFSNVDILVTHVPPYGILDTVGYTGMPTGWGGRHAGSRTILEYIMERHPRYVLCGHIHEGEG